MASDFCLESVVPGSRQVDGQAPCECGHSPFAHEIRPDGRSVCVVLSGCDCALYRQQPLPDQVNALRVRAVQMERKAREQQARIDELETAVHQLLLHGHKKARRLVEQLAERKVR